MKSATLISVLFALCSGRLLGFVSSGSTPEWLAHESSLIFIGVPQRVSVTHLSGDQSLTTVQFRIDRHIKGPLSAGDVVTVTSIDSKQSTDQMDLDRAVEKKREVLVLAGIAKHSFPEIEGRYIFLPHQCNRPVFYPDEPVKKIYDEAGNALRNYATVLERIEAQTTKEANLMRRDWPGRIVERWLPTKPGTDADQELNGGSAVIMKSLEYREPEEDPAPTDKSGRGGRIAPATPPTPPGMRLRTGRFQSDSLGD